MRQILLQNETAISLQNATKVSYKMPQVFYYKMRQLLQNVPAHCLKNYFCRFSLFTIIDNRSKLTVEFLLQNIEEKVKKWKNWKRIPVARVFSFELNQPVFLPSFLNYVPFVTTCLTCLMCLGALRACVP